jgi:hypothetical protein
MLFMVFNLGLDALTWNFKRTDAGNMDALFLRGGGSRLVAKHSVLYDSYLTYLKDVEKQHVFKGVEDRRRED